MTNFCFISCIWIKNFKAVKFCQHLFCSQDQPYRIPFPISRIYLKSFKNFRSPKFCNKRKFLPVQQTDFSSITWWSQLLRQMMYKFITVLLIQLILSSFLGQILLVVCLKICPLQPKFVKSQQTIHTCEMLVMTGNLL